MQIHLLIFKKKMNILNILLQHACKLTKYPDILQGAAHTVRARPHVDASRRRCGAQVTPICAAVTLRAAGIRRHSQAARAPGFVSDFALDLSDSSDEE